MPEQRPKVELKANIPSVMTFDPQPFKQGSGQYGPWFAFRVIEGGTEKTYFANDNTYPLIDGYLKRGVYSLRLTKVEHGKGFMTKIEPADSVQTFSQDLDRQVVEEKHDKEDEKWSKINAEKNQNIKWLSSINNACLLASQGKIEANLASIETFANHLYKLQPSSGEVINFEGEVVGF